MGVAWFLSAAVDTAGYSPKLVFGAVHGYEAEDPKHQKYYSETSVSPLLGGNPQFTLNVYGPDQSSEKPWRVYRITVEEVTP